VIFNPSSTMNLVGQLGVIQRAARQLQGVNQVDSQHAGTLNGSGVDPRQLESGLSAAFQRPAAARVCRHQPGEGAYAGRQQGGGQGLGYGRGGG